MTFKPLLASPVEFDCLDYNNLWLSPKLDGIRAIVIDGVVLSRKLLPIPNEHVQKLYGRPEFNGLDGELIVGSPNSPTVYTDTYSGVMKQTGKPEVTFYAFDHIADMGEEYMKRHARVYDISTRNPSVITLSQHTILNHDTLLQFEEMYLNDGYEGVMLRKYHGPKSKYKMGRSTAKEGTLLKLKRFVDSEAKIIGYEEEMENRNELTRDELGHAKRSSHQENLVGKGRLGALVCVTNEGVQFRIGTGFTANDRGLLWLKRDQLIGQYAKFKYFAIGVVEAPRFPVFLGFRSPIDL